MIVPEHIASTTDLVELYDLDPKVFFNKHIILAKDVDTVFKYALVGWKSPVYGRVKGLTQEDIGIDYWMNLIKTVDAMRPIQKAAQGK